MVLEKDEIVRLFRDKERETFLNLNNLPTRQSAVARLA